MDMTNQSRSAPTVSVVIPAYNAVAFLPRAVESVLGQTYSDFELIVVDDGSTDETPQVMEEYEDDVRYVRKENGGSASARNRGIREARGEYIALLDADDVWLPEKLERQMELHRTDPDLMWSYTNWLQVDQETGETIHRSDQIMENQGGDVLRPLIGRLFIPPSTQVFRRDVFEDVGTYDESDLHLTSEDWEFSLRVAEKYPIGYLDQPLVRRLRHGGKKTTTMDLDDALHDRQAIITKAVRRNPDRLTDLYNPAMANLYTKMGRKALDREERFRALRMFGTAIKYAPTYWRAWLYGASSLFPRSILRLMGRLRTLVWKASR